MPTYDYACNACGHQFEAFHGMSSMLTTCPTCGQETLRRRIGGGAGLIFKGSGFYQTDYRRRDAPAGDKPEAKADKPAAAPAEKPTPKTSNGD